MSHDSVKISLSLTDWDWVWQSHDSCVTHCQSLSQYQSIIHVTDTDGEWLTHWVTQSVSDIHSLTQWLSESLDWVTFIHSLTQWVSDTVTVTLSPHRFSHLLSQCHSRVTSLNESASERVTHSHWLTESLTSQSVSQSTKFTKVNTNYYHSVSFNFICSIAARHRLHRHADTFTYHYIHHQLRINFCVAKKL